MVTFLVRLSPPEVAGQDYSVILIHGDADGTAWPDQTIGPEMIPAAEVKNLLETQFRLDDNKRPKSADAAMGDALFKLLDRGVVGQKLHTVLDVNPAAAIPCRFILELPHELEGLPWELLRYDERLFLFMDSTRVWMRGTISPQDEFPARVWPLKVLIITGCPPADPSDPEDPIAYQEEVKAIRSALGRLGHAAEYVILEVPTRDQLLKAYYAFRPHLLHFIGHGKPALGAKKAELLFELPDNNGWSWPDDKIQMDLSAKAPPVALINACGSAVGGAGGWSVARAFLAAGSGAVIGMQADIPGTAAACFAKEFYGAIANAGDGPISLPEIVAKARGTVDTLNALSAWALPVFSLRLRPDRALPISLKPADRFTQNMPFIPEFINNEPFVNRRDERRLLRLCLDGVDFKPEPNQKSIESEQFLEMQALQKITAPAPPVLVLRGPSEIGKTRLALWLLEHGERRGLRTLYVNWTLAPNRDVVGVLRFIRDGEKNADSSLRAGFKDERKAFSKFNRDLNEILRGKKPRDEDPPSFVDDEYEPFTDNQARLEDGIDRLFESFREALSRATEQQRTVLALDQFDALEGSPARDYLRKRLFSEIAKNQIPELRLILVVTEAEFAKLELGKLAHRCIDLGAWPSTRFPELMSEYGNLQFKTKKAEESYRSYVEEWSDPFVPGDLRQTFRTYVRLANKTGPGGQP